MDMQLNWTLHSNITFHYSFLQAGKKPLVKTSACFSMKINIVKKKQLKQFPP